MQLDGAHPPSQTTRSRRPSQKNSRFDGIRRPYSQKDVKRLRGSVVIEHTLAKRGAEKLWDLLHTEDFVAALGALTGNQAVQQVKAGLKAIYLSGWQVAADANLAGHMYPDQSLYPANSVPAVVKRITNALLRADPVDHLFPTGGLRVEVFFGGRAGLDGGIARAKISAPYAGLLWGETSTPNLEGARRFAEEVRDEFPGKLLAYNCSPSFNWKKKLDS